MTSSSTSLDFCRKTHSYLSESPDLQTNTVLTRRHVYQYFRFISSLRCFWKHRFFLLEEKQKGSQQFKGTSSFTIHMEEKKKKTGWKLLDCSLNSASDVLKHTEEITLTISVSTPVTQGYHYCPTPCRYVRVQDTHDTLDFKIESCM